MTSKEAFKKLVEELKWCCSDGIELTDYDKSILEPILNDLNILDWIRLILEVYETGDTANKYAIRIKENIIEKEVFLRALKEWLNGQED